MTSIDYLFDFIFFKVITEQKTAIKLNKGIIIRGGKLMSALTKVWPMILAVKAVIKRERNIM